MRGLSILAVVTILSAAFVSHMAGVELGLNNRPSRQTWTVDSKLFSARYRKCDRVLSGKSGRSVEMRFVYPDSYEEDEMGMDGWSTDEKAVELRIPRLSVTRPHSGFRYQRVVPSQRDDP